MNSEKYVNKNHQIIHELPPTIKIVVLHIIFKRFVLIYCIEFVIYAMRMCHQIQFEFEKSKERKPKNNKN